MEIVQTHYSITDLEYLDHIPVIEEEIPYNEFFQNYLLKNQACVIKNVAKNWQSYRSWIANNGISFDYMLSKYGDLDVTVYNCEQKYYNSQTTENFKFKDYVAYWRNFKDNKASDLLYLKDWHLKNCTKDNFYEVPIYFSSDMLNEYLCETNQDDYRFVYMGPKGTWTPFHADVFNSYSWSTNVYGKKKWILFPPGAEDKLKDKLGNFPYNIDNTDHKGTHFEVIQNQSDAMFVPSGWYHQVYNLTDTISINHNWINATNLLKIYKAMEDKLELVKKEINDCKDADNYHEECQMILNATFGLDFKEFFSLLSHISLKRLSYLEEIVKHCKINDVMNKNHVIYDLESLCCTLKKFLHNEDVVYITGMYIDIENLINKIEFSLKVA